jgi:tRNA-specific 2-thiouridylase
MSQAIALFSGGLDSTLAILTLLKQGIKVTALKFLTPFEPEKNSYSQDIFFSAEKFGFEVKLCDITDKFLEIVKNPKFGHGKNMNPCIDCRIFMFKEAKKIMEIERADFILAGEVLGQRPMSQRKDVLYLIDKEAGVTDYVLRPLSAKLLKVTVPEAKGVINRDMLYDFWGRSRKPQMALAKEFGLTDYPAPAGGCLLTEPNYSHRLKELLTYKPHPSLDDLKLLKIGRHFRFSPSSKIIVGRNKAENEKLCSLSVKGCLLKVEGYGSPITLVAGEITEKALRTAASICARYSDAKNLSEVEVTFINNDYLSRLRVQPADNEIIEGLKIELKPSNRAPLKKIAMRQRIIT